ncbi:MAG: MmgE/PrpD family protein [Deltaproteobacteria bacterium]|nr:MmgE/PrpD family protein [Deltaproteobacteria bacterium]
MSSKTYAEKLSDFAVALRFEELPGDVVAMTKLSIMDNLGCMLAAREQDSVRIVADMVRSFGGIQQSSIIGYWDKVPAPWAAYCNGVANHSIELDDHISHKHSLSHPGVVSVPPAMALGEHLHTDGKEFVISVILGYEVTCRINRTVPPGFENFERGFHGTAITGPFGAAVLAGRLMGLSADQIATAMGIIGSLAAGSSEFKASGAWTKRLHAGTASKNGILAALLAQSGFTGPHTVLEGKHGFLNSYFGKGNYDTSVLTEKLGSTWEIRFIQYKPFACAGVIHSPATAALNLKNKHGLKAEEIAGIQIRTAQKMINNFAEPFEIKSKPRSVVDAQFSLPFTIALIFCNGSAMVDDYTETCIADENIRRFAGLVKCIPDPEINKVWPKDEPSAVIVQTVDGRVLEERVSCAKGSLEYPMTKEELIEKYTTLAAKTIRDDQISRSVDFLMNLENEPDISKLIDIFTTT